MATRSLSDFSYELHRATSLQPQNQLEAAQQKAAYELLELCNFYGLSVIGPGNQLENYPISGLEVLTEVSPEELLIIESSISAGREPSIQYLSDLIAAAEVAYALLMERAASQYGATVVARSHLAAKRDGFELWKDEIAPEFGLGTLSVQAAAVEARAAATAAERAAGTAAKARQAKSFDDLATSEGRRAAVLQLIAVVFLLTAACAAGWFVSRLPSHDAGLSDLLPRLSVVVPGAILFAYFVSEATAHRRHAAWARQIAVQLDTIEAYVSPMSAASQDQLLLSLGLAVYSGAALALVSGGRSQAESPTNIVGLQELLRDLLELSKVIKSA